jgi:2,4-dienoyl-CoA reductase (NADPH2)
VWGFDPENVARYRRASQAVHEAGAAFFCQLLHNGAHMASLFTDGPLWAPSPVTDPLSGEAAHEMTTDEIAEVVEGFARSAEICRDGGFDGVELHGSHAYLVQQFLSPLTNRRRDEYGGNEAGRQRFLFEIISAVRARIGSDFVVGVRLAGDERAPGGLTTGDAGRLAARLEADGTVDYVNISTGGPPSQGWIVLDATYDRGANLDAAAAVKAATGLPVLVAGRIAEPAEAEQALARGAADMIGVVRALMADPEWLAKGRAGREATIRPCTYCNECIAGIGVFRAIGCTVNPDLGHEGDTPTRPPRAAGPTPRVAVVGGGVAGLEAALTAAGRGHSVVLFEASDRLGGQILAAPATTFRRELLAFPAALADAVLEAGVDVRLGVAADADAVVATEPDSVIVATGSIPGEPAGRIGPGALSAVDVLTGKVSPGRRVLVAHDGGHPWEFDVVLELLAGADHEVTAVVPGTALSARGTDASLVVRLSRAGVVTVATSSVVGFTGGCAELRHSFTGALTSHPGFDSFVLAATRRANHDLADALRARGTTVEVVGDGLAPRSLRDAVWEARAAARRIGGPG